MNQPEYFTFPNGIRVIHVQVPHEVAHLGVYINAGSRDELPNEFGLAHFIEHAIFKGTARRKAFHVLSRMEDVGGEINAYTSKEETCVYSSFLKVHYSRAIDLLADIVFNSTFPEKELEKEKTVVIDEINSYKDSPSEEIFDRFEDQIFRAHSLGHDILGTPAHLKRFTGKSIRAFIDRTWNTDQMVVSSVGNVSFKILLKLLQPVFGSVAENRRSFKRISPDILAPESTVYSRKVHQSHLIMGCRAYGIQDDRRTPLIVLNNLLGGPGMSSRLNLNIREKFGFTYQIESSYTLFIDSGVWNVYLGTETASVEKCRALVLKELKKLRDQKLGILQLHKAQNQLIGQMAIAQESNASLMLGFAKTFAIFGKIDSFKEVSDRIRQVTSSNLCDIAGDVFREDQLSSILYSGK